MTKFEIFTGLLLWSAFVFVFGAGVQALIVHDKYRTEAIEHGYAQHNKETGEWEWIDK